MIVLIAAVVLLTAVTMVHLLLTFALVRRVRELQERAPAPDGSLPPAGTPVGPFAVDRVGGGRLDTDDLSVGDAFVGFFTAGCAPCRTVVGQLLADPPPGRFVAFVGHGDDEGTAALAQRLAEVAEVAVLAWDSPVPDAFRQQAFPTLLRVRDGVIVEAGYRLGDLGRLAVR